jgi:hypothetical protein
MSLLGPLFHVFPRQFLQTIRPFTEVLSAHQMACLPLKSRTRTFAAAAIFLNLLMTAVPGLNMFRPVRIVRFFPGPRCHRRSSMVVKEPHLFLSRICKRMCRGRTLTYVGW